MTSEYIVRSLESERVTQAFPLIRDVVGCASLEEWTRFALALTAPSGAGAPEQASGIMIAERQGYIRGLCSYQIQPHLGHGLVMFIHHLAVLEVVGREAVADALLDALRDIAERSDCRALHAMLPPTAQWAVGYMQERGLAVESYCMCRDWAAEA